MLIDKSKIIPHEENQRIAKDREMLSTFANVDFQRTRFWCLAAAVAINVPRRIPGARPKALSEDKRVSRKVCYEYLTLWRMIHKHMGFPAPPDWDKRPVVTNDPLMARIGTTVIWDRQVNYLIDVVMARSTKLSDFQELALGDNMMKWYVKHGALLEWELDALHRVKNYLEKGQGPATKQTLAT